MKLKMTITANVKEHDLIESCLNYYHSGYNYMVILSLYALAKGWNIEKLTKYINLIEEK